MNRTIRVFFPRGREFLLNPNCGHYPPLHVSAHCLYPGMLVEILNAVSKVLDVSIVPLVAPDYLSDAQVGLYAEEMLLEDRADMIARPWQKTKRQAKLFDFSDWVYFANYRFIRAKSPQQYDQFWSFFRTYDVWVWTAIGVVWVAQWLACAAVCRAEGAIMREKRAGPAACAWHVLRILLQQSVRPPFRSRSGRFSLMLFSLLQYAIVGIYSSFILAAIISRPPAERLDVEAVIRHLDRREYRLVTARPQFANDVLNFSNMFPFVQLREALQSNPVHVVKTHDELGRHLHKEGDITILINDIDYFTGSNCELTVMAEDFPPAEAFFVLRKNSRWTAAINRALRLTRGQIASIVERYSIYAKKHTNCTKEITRRPLRFSPYFGLLAVSAGVMLAAAGVLLVELFAAKFRHVK